MAIVLYRGAKGKSKTLTMVKDALKYKKSGWLVYTNLTKSPFKLVSSEFILTLSGDSSLKNCVLCIDEIELFFDSRDWNRKESKSFGRFLQQIRKRNVIILCTSQFTNLIEIRLRQQIDILVVCEYNRKSNVSTCIYIDLTSVESDPYNLKSFSISYFAPPLFGLYDTNELI